MTARGPNLPSARHRLGLLVGFFVVELIVAWVLAAPFAELAARLLGTHPDGDKAMFFAPGLYLLFDLGAHHGAALRALLSGTLVGLLVWGAFAVLLEGALFAGLAEPGSLTAARLGERTGAVALRMLGLAAIGLVGFLVLIILFGFAPISTMSSKLEGATPRASALAYAVPVVASVVVIGLLQAFLDLARALCVRHERSVAGALTLVVRAPRRVLGLFALAAPRWLAVLGLVGFGAAFSADSRSVLAIFVVHQALAFGRVVLRGSVVSRALRVSDELVASAPAAS